MYSLKMFRQNIFIDWKEIVMQQQSSSTMFFAGLQWLFFMFANTVVIPITIGDAFDLSSVEVASALQRSLLAHRDR